MVVATVAFCIGGCLLGGAGIFLLLNVGDYQSLRTLRRLRVRSVAQAGGGRVAVEGHIEYGPAGPQTAPVTAEQCAWFHVRLIREPSRHYTSSDDPDHDVLLDFSSPGGFTLADHSGRVPVDPALLDVLNTTGPSVAVHTKIMHKRSKPETLPPVVPREIVDDLRKSERLTLTETRVPRGAQVFALGRLSNGELKRSFAGLTVFSSNSRDKVIASRKDDIGLGARMVVGFGLAGLILAAGSAAYLTTLA